MTHSDHHHQHRAQHDPAPRHNSGQPDPGPGPLQARLAELGRKMLLHVNSDQELVRQGVGVLVNVLIYKDLLFIIFKSGGMRNRIVSGEEEDFSSQEIRNGSSRD